MMHIALMQVMEALVSTPEKSMAQLDVLPPSERQKLLVEWNATAAEYPKDKCIHQLFEEQVERDPEATAVVYADRSLSYADLNSRANRLARHLVSLGVRPDSRVAICVERSLEMVIGLIAILKAGGAYIPLDPSYPPERLSYMLRDSAPAIMLTHAAARVRLQVAQEVAAHVTGFVHGRSFEADIGDWATYSNTNLDATAIGLTPHNLAYVIYTSGSTRKPKGVMVEHKNVTWVLTNNGFSTFDARDRHAFASNSFFDVSAWQIWGGLLFGGTIVVFNGADVLEQLRFKAFLERHAISCLWMAAGLFNQYADVLCAIYHRASELFGRGRRCY